MSSTALFSITSTLVSSSAILFSPLTRGSVLSMTAASVFVLAVSLAPVWADLLLIKVFLVAAPVVFAVDFTEEVVNLLFAVFVLSIPFDMVLDVECADGFVVVVLVDGDAVLDGRFVDRIWLVVFLVSFSAAVLAVALAALDAKGLRAVVDKVDLPVVGRLLGREVVPLTNLLPSVLSVDFVVVVGFLVAGAEVLAAGVGRVVVGLAAGPDGLLEGGLGAVEPAGLVDLSAVLDVDRGALVAVVFVGAGLVVGASFGAAGLAEVGFVVVGLVVGFAAAGLLVLAGIVCLAIVFFSVLFVIGVLVVGVLVDGVFVDGVLVGVALPGVARLGVALPGVILGGALSVAALAGVFFVLEGDLTSTNSGDLANFRVSSGMSLTGALTTSASAGEEVTGSISTDGKTAGSVSKSVGTGEASTGAITGEASIGDSAGDRGVGDISFGLISIVDSIIDTVSAALSS